MIYLGQEKYFVFEHEGKTYRTENGNKFFYNGTSEVYNESLLLMLRTEYKEKVINSNYKLIKMLTKL